MKILPNIIISLDFLTRRFKEKNHKITGGMYKYRQSIYFLTQSISTQGRSSLYCKTYSGGTICLLTFCFAVWPGRRAHACWLEGLELMFWQSLGTIAEPHCVAAASSGKGDNTCNPKTPTE